MAKIKRDLSEEAREGFTDMIGYMPKEDDLVEVFSNEPGLGRLIHHILDPQKYYQDQNTENRKK